MSYICMLIWCGVMMLITSVAISCCRVIAGSTSVCLRMLGVAEDSDSDERRRDSARLQPPQIYITVPPSSLSLFHLSVLLHRWAPDLNSSLSPVRLGKYIIQSARAPCLWLEPQTYTYAFTHEKKKVTHNQRMQIRVCVCKRSSTWHLGAFSGLCTCHLGSKWRTRGSAPLGDVLGRLVWNSWGLFEFVQRSWRGFCLFVICSYFLPRKRGMLFILCCFVFAPSWSRKFLTSRSPLPSHFKGSHFSQLVGPVWRHLGFDKAPSPQLQIDNESPPLLFMCVVSFIAVRSSTKATRI